MQASVQTDRKKKKPENLHPANMSALPEVQEEDQKQKQRKIKKLTLINRELIDTLKRQNEELSKKINKQKIKIGRSVDKSQRVESPARNLEKQKKQLANAYKQIEMYKTVLKDLKAKEISSQSADKLTSLENKITFQEATIERLQKELKYAKNIKQQQEKQLHLYSNKDVKATVSELQQQLKDLKQKLKQAKKLTKKRESVAMKQHAYFMELQKQLRKHNGEYYPGLVAPVKKDKKQKTLGEDTQEISQRQWQILKSQLDSLKKSHEENNKKIQNLTRNKNKEIKSLDDNETRLKQKQRKLQTLKMKIATLSKLIGDIKEDNRSIEKSQIVENDATHQEDQVGDYQNVVKNGKKVFKSKNPQNDRQIKKWIIPQGYVQQFGKIIPDSAFFSDKTELKYTRKSKITKIQVWYDKNTSPLLCQFFYLSQQNKMVAGIIPYAPHELLDYEDKVIQFKEGDYLAKIQGKFYQGYLTSLTLISKFQKKEEFNANGIGQSFKFDPRPNELPTCMFGAAVKDERDRIRTCYLGCQFIADW